MTTNNNENIADAEMQLTYSLDQCRELAHSDSILDRLDEELRGQGFAGSTKIPQLVYLALFTRFFEKPVSLVIKGPSSGGKSWALKAALQYIPESAYELFHGMSERALVYSGIDFRHRYLIIQEAAGMSEGVGRTYLRQLISEGEVRYGTVQSGNSGLAYQELPPIEGPVGLMMTTTANFLHPEDETRLLSLHIDESPDRIREMLMALATMESRPVNSSQFDAWHSFHEFIGSEDPLVEVPFIEHLARAMPISSHRVTRDFGQVRSLIEAHALMHLCTRERSPSGAVIATMEDYRNVYELVVEPLSHSLEVAVEDRIREVVDAVKELQEEDRSGDTHPFSSPRISQQQLADHLGRNQSVISRNVTAAIERGYLEDQNPGPGRRSELVLGERELPTGSALPTPEELERLLEPSHPVGTASNQVASSSTLEQPDGWPAPRNVESEPTR